MMVAIVLMKMDYGSMRQHEMNAIHGDLYTTPDRPYADAEDEIDETKGSVIDLLFPVIALIICCVIGMIYTGGFFSGSGFVEAFSNSDASVGLMLGSFFAFIITIIFYAVRKVLRFSESMSCVPEGFKAMVPAILILTFAWTLKAMTDSLGAAEYVAGVMDSAASGFVNLLPAIIFLVGCFLAFCNRHILGDVRHPDSDRCCRICRNQRKDDDHIHLRLHGRRSLRRPLLANL